MTTVRQPAVELRQLIATAIATEWRKQAKQHIEATPEDHADALANAIMAIFIAVDEDYSSVELRHGDGRESVMWHRRLIAKTLWQPTTNPEAEHP